MDDPAEARKSRWSSWAVLPFVTATWKEEGQYGVDGKSKVVEALGFLKDWVTSVLQIETAVLGAVGAATVLKNEPDIKLTHAQVIVVVLAAVCFGISIFCGTMTLNMLPGAVQRVAKTSAAEHNDIYSIYTASKMRIYDWVVYFRLSFQAGIILVPAFIILRAFKV